MNDIWVKARLQAALFCVILREKTLASKFFRKYCRKSVLFLQRIIFTKFTVKTHKFAISVYHIEPLFARISAQEKYT